MIHYLLFIFLHLPISRKSRQPSSQHCYNHQHLDTVWLWTVKTSWLLVFWTSNQKLWQEDKPGVCSLYWDNIVSTENIPTNHQFSLRKCQACILYCDRSPLNVSYSFLPGTENEPPTSKELESVRQKAISKLEEIGSSQIIPADLERIRSNNQYVSRYFFLLMIVNDFCNI